MNLFAGERRRMARLLGAISPGLGSAAAESFLDAFFAAAPRPHALGLRLLLGLLARMPGVALRMGDSRSYWLREAVVVVKTLALLAGEGWVPEVPAARGARSGIES